MIHLLWPTIYSALTQENQWRETKATSRHATDDPARAWVDGVQDANAVNTAMQGNINVSNPQGGLISIGSIGDLYHRLLSRDYFTSWQAFASTYLFRAKLTTDYLSVEFIHNSLHVRLSCDFFAMTNMAFLKPVRSILLTPLRLSSVEI